MAIFMTGVTGFIGGSVAARLIGAGANMRGLVRNPEKAAAAEAFGITPVVGTLADHELRARTPTTRALLWGTALKAGVLREPQSTHAEWSKRPLCSDQADSENGSGG